MWSKNQKRHTQAESDHMAAVKSLPCSVCDEPAPSAAHHVKQGNHFTTVALCQSCHQCPHNGIHGQRRMWLIKKMDEDDALNVTIRRLMEAR